MIQIDSIPTRQTYILFINLGIVFYHSLTTILESRRTNIFKQMRTEIIDFTVFGRLIFCIFHIIQYLNEVQIIIYINWKNNKLQTFHNFDIACTSILCFFTNFCRSYIRVFYKMINVKDRVLIEKRRSIQNGL